MKILSVNCGSSSLKFQAYEMPEETVLISGYFEKIGLEDSFYTLKLNGEKIKKVVSVKDHAVAAEILIKELLENNIVSDLAEIKGVGHRLVHGGDKYADSVVIDEDVIATVTELSPLAPLHNPANLIGVKAMMKAIPNAIHTAVFDTAFHQTMPEVNYLYSVPYSWYRDYKIRKYGFHGTSHKYITNVMQEKLGTKDVNLIIAHIGSGGSLTAVKNGKSYDTTMGFGPNAGITMGTRCGDIDYSTILYAMKKTGMTFEEIDSILNKKSGLLGISEKYSDHRDIEAGIDSGDKQCKLADKVYIDRIVKYISEYYVELEGKVDAIVLTAGTGENARDVRKDIIDKLNCLGIYLDRDKNSKIASFLDVKEGLISTADSKVPVYVIPTDEEVVIARDAYNFAK
ncbi:MAG: acetate kinase [Tenericutes bacterium]|nr:acetate kinase [Mycoplasmatota bacterium]MDY3801620.1 acetate kinase [Bacilli bacterium]